MIGGIYYLEGVKCIERMNLKNILSISMFENLL